MERHLDSANIEFIEQQYNRYLDDPASVDPSWRRFFELEFEPMGGEKVRGPTVSKRSIFNPWPQQLPCPGWHGHEEGTVGTPVCFQALKTSDRLSRIYQLVNNFRVRGHMLANLDPLGQRKVQLPPELELSWYGLTEKDLAVSVPNGGFVGPATMKLGDLVQALRQTYCNTIGVEYMNIQDPEQKAWLQERMETTRNYRPLSRPEQVAILEKLVAAEGLEQFLHTKYVGTKRFSLQGAESLIPMLDVIIELCGEAGVDEIVMGMPHRGRLNVIVNTLGQEPYRLFSQFEDIDPRSTLGSGDVKYHLGFCTNRHFTRKNHRMHISLTANPSHLEAVNPVVQGRTRAKQDRRGDFKHEHGMAVLIHGDAAFAGQGLVAETLNLAGLEGYRTGGTIHIVVNNQIGFTTPPTSSRSTPYSTDVARMMQIPIFHVNGEDPEAVVQVTQLAMGFRNTFKKDVVIDMFCWRKYGHNETDEPAFTQPLMYKVIDAHPSVSKIYADRMVRSGMLSREEAEAIVLRQREKLEKDLERVRTQPEPFRMSSMGGLWSGYQGGAEAASEEVGTGVPRETLTEISDRMTRVPDGFTPHRKIARLLQTRQAMGRGELELDWGMAEALAFGSLVWEGHPVRLSGQDSRRGTFSHRHASLTDVNDGREILPLALLKPGQARFQVYDSALSEAGVLGFEFGYSMNAPDALVMWEAQFGDFANGAQVIIDQFIASSEDKWGRLSGLVMLLPHGYEGQGPEHSSARLERFLQLAARDNIQVCNCTTPVQYFHLLRRQVKRSLRKPLIIMTPKSLLRHPLATSSLEELTRGRFMRVLPDPTVPMAQASRLILCSGKVYYDLLDEARKRGKTDVALVRVEQLYPFPKTPIQSLLEQAPHLTEVSWVQEEPRNMGGWTFMLSRWLDEPGWPTLRCFSRPEGASPATGSHKAHHIELHMLMDQIFGD